MDWRIDARASFEALPDHVREIVLAARAELVTAKDPYFRGIEADVGLPDGMGVRPIQSADPKGPHALFFDHGMGWMKYTFVRRTEDPQITVEEIFWLGGEPPTEPPAEA
jgi:hypothetical protein